MIHSRLLFAPESRQAINRGFDALARLVAITLGPQGHTIAMARENRRRGPELLRNGAYVARRFLGFPSRFETMGAFLARHVAWRMEEAVGDGATTAVLIANALLKAAERQVAAGHNPMVLRRGIEKLLPALLDGIQAQATPLMTEAQIVALATALVGDQTLGRFLEEIFDTVGPHGAIQVRTSYARTHDRRYIQGTFWNQGWVSSYFTTEAGSAVLQSPYLLFTTRPLTTADELLPILNQVREAGGGGLVVFSPEIRGDALNILVTNKTRKALPTLAIKAPGLGSEKHEILADLAALCGGQLLRDEAGLRVETATVAALGRADEVQAIRSGFTIIGGKGRPAVIRQRQQELQRALKDAEYGRERDRLNERIGKLLGGVALLEIGGATESEREYFKVRAKSALQSLRLALQEGILPGGGVAYLRLLSCLDKQAQQLQLVGDEVAAVPILRAALLAPATTILTNAGIEAAPIIHRLLNDPTAVGYDVLQGEQIVTAETTIVDPAKVAQAALRIGASGALMALTTDTLVHRPRHNRDEEVDLRV